MGLAFVELGAPVWDIQAQGLSKASYINPRHGYGAAEERRFPRYTGGVTWFSEMAEGEGEGTAAAVTQNRPPRASAASWRA